LNGFAKAQIDRRNAWNRRYADFDWRPRLRDPEQPIEWLKVDDAYGNSRAYVPADFAFIGRRQVGDEAAVAIGDSNGCACDPDADAAKLAAVLELIERDAAGRWWYGGRQRPSLDPSSIATERKLTTWLASRSRRTWLVDITTDIDIPVVAAASAEADGTDAVLGFSARLNIQSAALAALTEMVQIEFSLTTARSLRDAAGHWPEWRARIRMPPPPTEAMPTPESLSGAGNSHPPLTRAVEACARAKIQLWFADMTRDVIGLPAFRALSPDLCHIKPRFARERLLAPDPRDLGPILAGPEGQVPLLI
jgi:ribosomal protein S12 methylthiotransferase accessory factor